MPEALDYSAAADLLALHLPEAGDQPLEYVGGGDYCLAFRLDGLIVRMARHAEAAGALQREACVLSAIADSLPLPVPRPVYHEPKGCPAFSTHREITGTVLTRDDWMDLGPAARERTAGDLAAFLGALHTLPAELGRQCGVPHIEEHEYARSLRAAASRVLYPLLERAIARSLDGLLAAWSSPTDARATPSVLLHGDIAPGHLLWDPATGRLSGVIDFGDLCLGPPARDFVFVYEDFGLPILRDTLRHYGGPGAGTLLPEVRKWYLLEAIGWTSNMASAQRHVEVQHGLGEINRELAAVLEQQPVTGEMRTP